MNSTLKLWTQLGLGTALAGGLLAACGGEAGGEGAGGEPGAAPDTAATAGEGEGGAEVILNNRGYGHAQYITASDHFDGACFHSNRLRAGCGVIATTLGTTQRPALTD